MKEVCFEATVPGCSTRDFYELACSEPTALLEFHRKVNKDDSVEVAWEDDSKKARLCTYTLQTIAIPATLQSFVGAGPIMVKEKQVFTWLDKDTLQIVSRPMVQIKYGKAMKTEAEMTLRPAGEGGCQFDVKARVTARLPWAMQYLTSSIEMMMAAEARRTVASYVNFITKFVQDGLPGLHEQRRQQQQQQQQQQQPALVVAAGEEQQPEEMMLDLAGSEASGSEAGAEAVIIQQTTTTAALASAAPGAGKPSAALAAAATTLQLQATAGGAAAPAPPAPSAAAVPAWAIVSSGDSEVFYDAQEVTRTDALLEALLRELQAAKEQRAAANRLLEEVRDSVARTEAVVSKEVAFQEGVRFAQRGSSTTLMLSVAAAAATASAVTAMLVVRRSK